MATQVAVRSMVHRGLHIPCDPATVTRYDCEPFVSGGVLSLPRLPVWVLPGCAGPCFGVLLRRISVLTI